MTWRLFLPWIVIALIPILGLTALDIFYPETTKTITIIVLGGTLGYIGAGVGLSWQRRWEWKRQWDEDINGNS